MALTINIPQGTTQLSGNAVYIEVTSDNVQGELYKILLKITSTDNAIEGGPWEMGIAPGDNGKSTFDISAIVDAPVDYNFSYPATAAVVEHPLLAFNVQIEVAESYFDEYGV